MEIKINKKNSIIISLHILFWILNIVRNRTFAPDYPLWSLAIDQILIAGVCYLNYFIFVPYLLKQNKTLYFICWGLVFIGLFSIIYTTWCLVYFKVTKPESADFNFFRALRLSFLSSFFYAAMSTGSRLALDWQVNLDTNRKLLIQKTNAQIQLMKSNINIPFMLQSLDYAEAVAIETPKNADQPILLLSNVLRYGLYDSQAEEIELSREIDVLNDFIALNNQMEKSFSLALEMHGDEEKIKVIPNLLVRFLGSWKAQVSNNLSGLQEIQLVIENNSIKMNLPLKSNTEEIGPILKNQFQDYKNDKFSVTYKQYLSSFTLTFINLEK